MKPTMKTGGLDARACLQLACAIGALALLAKWYLAGFSWWM